MIESCKRLPDWRADVRAAFLNADGTPKGWFEGGVSLRLDFVLPRPKSTPKKSTPQATKKPDLSKLLRAVEDAITSAGVWKDDSQVIAAHVGKRLAEIGETPGCHVKLTRIEA